jgi:hypothetical protein
MDTRQMVADLRLEAVRLQEEVKRLQQAADLLDPPQTIDASISVRASAQAHSSAEANTADENPRETIIEIVVAALKKAGVALPKDALFEQVRTRGGRVANIESFTSALSRADEVVYRKDGLWDLAERHAEQKSFFGAVGEPTVEQIREFLQSKSARISDLARHFQTSKQSIRKIVEDPASNITFKGPGWLILRPSGPTNPSNSGGQ